MGRTLQSWSVASEDASRGGVIGPLPSMPARNGAAVYTRPSGPGSRRLVRLRPYRLRDARFPTPHAGLGWLRRAELGIGQEAHRRPRLPLDLRLPRGRAAEPTLGEPAPP